MIGNQPNREAWLSHCIKLMRPHFEAAGYTLPDNIKATCGFPSRNALGAKKRRGAEVWQMDLSAAGVFEVFISPLLDQPLRVADMLCHELVHVAVGLDKKHGRAFRKCAEGVGLTGEKMAQTEAGEAFKRWFEGAQSELGDYPHGALSVPVKTSGPKKQTARLIKVSCPACEAEEKPYIARMALATIARGAPVCPFHQIPMVPELPEGVELPEIEEDETQAEAPALQLVPPADPMDPPPGLDRFARPEGPLWVGAQRWNVFLEMEAPTLGCGERRVWVAVAGRHVHLAHGDKRARITAPEWQQIARSGQQLQ